MPPVDVINAIEVVWWPMCGVIVLARSFNVSREWKRLGLIAGFCLFLFGASDVVELYTKAWWQPWWLLVWKGACIITLLTCVAVRIRMQRASERSI